jgi:hypothetical protein
MVLFYFEAFTVFMQKYLKKALFLFLFLCLLPEQYAAEPDALSDDDAGQIIFRNIDAEVFVFRKKLPRNLWYCTPFKDNGSVSLAPESCTVSEFHEDTLTPEDLALSLVYFSGKNTPRHKLIAIACKNMAEKINAPKTSALLTFNATLEKDLKNIANEIQAVRKKQAFADEAEESKTDPFVDAVLIQLETSGALAIISDFLDKDRNFFAAYCLWEKYRNAFNRNIRLSGGQMREVNKQIDKTAEDILAKFRQHSTANRKRCNDFKKACPRKYGPWEYVPPRNEREMKKRVESCFNAWLKLQRCSAFSEFPDWGNAALEVMQMIPTPELEQKFDNAYRNYLKHLNN